MKQELRLFFSGEAYRDSVKKRIIEGSAPTIELYFLQLLYGKPTDHVQVDVSVQQEDLWSLSTEELALRATRLLSQLEEAQQVEDALPAEFKPVRSERPVAVLVEETDSPNGETSIRQLEKPLREESQP